MLMLTSPQPPERPARWEVVEGLPIPAKGSGRGSTTLNAAIRNLGVGQCLRIPNVARANVAPRLVEISHAARDNRAYTTRTLNNVLHVWRTR